MAKKTKATAKHTAVLMTEVEREEMRKHVADIRAGNYVADLEDYQTEWIATVFDDELRLIDTAAYFAFRLLDSDGRDKAMGIGVAGCYTRANKPDDYFREAERMARDFAGRCSVEQKREAVTRQIETDMGAAGGFPYNRPKPDSDKLGQWLHHVGAWIDADIVDALGLTGVALAHGWGRVHGGGRDCFIPNGFQPPCDIYEPAAANKYRLEREAAERAADEERAQLERDAHVGRTIGDKLEKMKAGVDYLVDKKRTRSRNGRAAQQKANADPEIQEAKERAADDMKKAIERVRDEPGVKEGKHGALLAACRRVCREFKPLTSNRNALGKFEQYRPLWDWQDKPIQPETLARNYRELQKKPASKAKAKRVKR